MLLPDFLVAKYNKAWGWINGWRFMGMLGALLASSFCILKTYKVTQEGFGL